MSIQYANLSYYVRIFVSGYIWMYLPKVAYDWSISPAVLCVQANCSVLVDDQVERLIKPSEGEMVLVNQTTHA